MVDFEKDEVPMLSDMYSQGDEQEETNFQGFSSRYRSASMSISRNSMEPYENGDNFIGYTGPLRNERRTSFIQMSGPLYISRNHENLFRPTQGTIGRKTTEPTVDKYHSFKGMDQDGWPDNYPGKNEHLLKSGQLGVCNDPYCTTCPTYYDLKGRKNNSKSSVIFDPKIVSFSMIDHLATGNFPVICASMQMFHNILYGDAKGWPGRIFSFLNPYIPGVMNPHTKVVQQWNKFIVISCLVAIFVDPLFFFLLTVQQFRLAYVAPESRVVGAGELVDHPKKIALNYLFGYFLLDLFIVLPLPQIVILLLIPRFIGLSGANYAKNLLRAAVLVQYIPRLYRFLPLMVGQSPSGFTFESAWANFVMNLLTFVLSGHVVGSSWYLLGLQVVIVIFLLLSLIQQFMLGFSTLLLPST
ncbi:hypothetical protein TEA_028126 [Camellia sinensis var. sinensis]|uniref:Uncharacterized protein n=1 Tax=Camellia sinensis var. sinensis TaxID=542762 RepID=A0A4S4E458_CAMSN|nr:hypothetical protein TEA_028126 [Camellia sinensis var. sinensis]